MDKPQKNPNRIAKVNSLIEHELGPILHEFFEGENGLVTVSKVETSRDMRWAKVWVSVFGGDDNKIFNRINTHIYEIQGELNKSFATKIIPRLQFFLDTSPRYAQHIDEMIKKMHAEEQLSGTAE
ncbi:MAG: ribosome-binding factor A [Patescibacteria group bacterium]|nr:ribosome-binding factor A [Patescibacteria group bacterium]